MGTPQKMIRLSPQVSTTHGAVSFKPSSPAFHGILSNLVRNGMTLTNNPLQFPLRESLIPLLIPYCPPAKKQTRAGRVPSANRAETKPPLRPLRPNRNRRRGATISQAASPGTASWKAKLKEFKVMTMAGTSDSPELPDSTRLDGARSRVATRRDERERAAARERSLKKREGQGGNKQQHERVFKKKKRRSTAEKKRRLDGWGAFFRGFRNPRNWHEGWFSAWGCQLSNHRRGGSWRITKGREEKRVESTWPKAPGPNRAWGPCGRAVLALKSNQKE